MSVIFAVVLLIPENSTETVARRFLQLGFDAEIIAAETLLISAGQGQFQDVFKTCLDIGESGVHVMKPEGLTRALPLSALPHDLSGLIKAIEFESPPDFGPGNF